ncbi:hypothetical protein CANCADRAFT_2802 [Tortispora caseinolytica NRRL Y-17796]|uniref:Plus3 domain-containing protein n=1 Tax=Tortispora caseinolytica NRRL Y-17796 TaxID=767744 RepID=A0A1E4TH48_9ASCO|nr:hypothetical protein CANCADRAFT_2802 [Tortispora caseinolytica NRRL Y-17796]
MDFDDDLLALAAGEQAANETANTKRRRISDDDLDSGSGSDSGSDSELSELDEDEAAAGAGVGADAHEDEDNIEEPPPYPLYGKYKDEEDMEWLEGLPEIEREQTLFDRSQEMQRYNERKYLAQRLKTQREQAAKREQRSTRQREQKSDVRKSRLQELTKKRKARETRRQRIEKDGYEPAHIDSDEESKGSYSSEEDDYEPEYSGKPTSKDEVEWASDDDQDVDATLKDLNKVRFGRTLFTKYCHHPQFEAAIVGCYVRINIGFNRQTGQSVYRVCQVVRLVPSKTYSFMNRTVNQKIVAVHGKAEREFEFGICSDSPFTEEEFDWWKSTLKKEGSVVPSRAKLLRKFKQLKEMSEHKLTQEEQNEIIEKRRLLSGAHVPHLLVLRKSELHQFLLVAREQGNSEKVAELEAEIKEIDTKLESSKKAVEDSQLSKLAKVNARNRKSNQEEIRKAELLANEEKRQGASAITDPFKRFKTNTRIFYNSDSSRVSSETPAVDKEPQTQPEVNETPSSVSQTSKSIDDLIAEIGIEIEI